MTSASDPVGSDSDLYVPAHSSDPGWKYGYLSKKLDQRTVICSLCGKLIKGGINRFKKHIAHIRGDVIPCPESTEEAKEIVRENLESFQKRREERRTGGLDSEVSLLASSKNSKGSRRRVEKYSEEFDDSIPQFRRSNHLRSTRKRSNDDKQLDTDMFESFLGDIWSRIPEEKRGFFAYLDSLWFSLYRDESTRSKVLGWIKNKQVFSRKYVFVPIVCWRHWRLLILCHFGDANRSKNRKPCMLLLDSLQETEPKKLEPEIRRFIYDIYKSEGREESKIFISEIPLLIPKVPQQTNGEECGEYVLYFIYLFLQNAPDIFTQKDYPYFLTEEWFDQKDKENFSMKIQSFLMSREKLKVELHETTDYASPQDCQIYTGNIIDID